MLIKVKRKPEAARITSFSQADKPSLAFDSAEETFEIPIEFLSELTDFFDPFFPKSQQEIAIGDFLLGSK